MGQRVSPLRHHSVHPVAHHPVRTKSSIKLSHPIRRIGSVASAASNNSNTIPDSNTQGQSIIVNASITSPLSAHDAIFLSWFGVLVLMPFLRAAVRLRGVLLLLLLLHLLFPILPLTVGFVYFQVRRSKLDSSGCAAEHVENCLGDRYEGRAGSVLDLNNEDDIYRDASLWGSDVVPVGS